MTSGKTKILKASEIETMTAELVVRANGTLPPDAELALLNARANEQSQAGRMVLDILLQNVLCARRTGLPLCQDTGIDVLLVEIGQDLRIQGDLASAVNDGLAKGTRAGLLRTSVCDPLTRKNTGNNTPGVVHIEMVQGDALKITVMPKGCGSENMSGIVMLPPSAGENGVIDAVADTVRRAGPNPCPPGFIGIGIGGTMEKAALLAKKALSRPLGSRSKRRDIRMLEDAILDRLNNLGIGPVGLGGNITALDVAVETYPCHIASLPVAINIQCHAVRHASARWSGGTWQVENAGNITHPITDKTIGEPRWPRVRRIQLPLTRETASELRAGEWVFLNGPVYTGRDQTHRCMKELMEQGRPLPVDFSGQLIYYVGPSPAPEGRAAGAAGPTTSYRMDAYTPMMLEQGVLATMGKGKRSQGVIDSLKEHGAVYLATIGGAGAYLSDRITSCEPAAFEDLGPEALFRMVLKDFPAVVINDALGNDYYRQCCPHRS